MKWAIHIILCFRFNFLVNADENEGKREITLEQNHPIFRISASLKVPCNESMCTGPLAEIYCHGPILMNAWQFGLQKTCPGDRLLIPAEDVYANFKKLKYPILRDDFEAFCKENFEERGYLQIADLKDWTADPKFLEQIANVNHRKLSKELHDRWKRLARVFTQDVLQNPDMYPLIPVDKPFIVPGGRFDVYFYWDTYWIVKGLLVSEMFDTVRGIIDNFSSLVDKLGYIPNSGNIQLTRRSQPPLFGHMIWEYTKSTRKYNAEWLPRMKKEVEFWEKNRTISIGNYNMFVYKTATNCPRPENFLADYNLGIQTSDPATVWRSISSACESGWDFSSRWMHHDNSSADLSSLHTDKIVPVDLNVIIANNYRYLAAYYDYFGRFDESAIYREKFEKLSEAIGSVLWDEQQGAWFDYDLLAKRKNLNFYPSNLYPLMIPGFEKYSSKVENYVRNCGALDFHGGIPSSLPAQSTQQWDFPNVWAPNQHFVVNSFLSSNSSYLQQKAREQALMFIESVFNGLYNPIDGNEGGIWEKYDARTTAGRPGSGGEYSVQEGFGWTNGAVLDLIWAFRTHGRNDNSGTEELTLNNSQHATIVYVAISFCALVAIIVLLKGIICSTRRYEELIDDRDAEERLIEKRLRLLTRPQRRIPIQQHPQSNSFMRTGGKDLNIELDRAKEQIEEMMNTLTKKKQELSSSEREATSLRFALNNTERQLGQMQDNFRTEKNSTMRYIYELRRLNNEMKVLQKERDDAVLLVDQTKKAGDGEKIIKLTQQVEQLAAQLENQRIHTFFQAQEIEKKKADAVEMEKELGMFQGRALTAEYAYTTAVAQIAQHQGQLSMLRQQLENSHHHAIGNQLEIQQKNALIDAAAKERESARTNCDELTLYKLESEHLRSELEEARRQKEEMSRAMLMLEADRARLVSQLNCRKETKKTTKNSKEGSQWDEGEEEDDDSMMASENNTESAFGRQIWHS
ncbi:unnamed protein product [Caenorhabditis sp. 36 PRJEB53466]|nr:unnamed protein product [Caenorhabditis sp. 36 PRJEB53466]